MASARRFDLLVLQILNAQGFFAMTLNSVTRVELHGSAGADYAGLHKAMETAGFSRIITADNGTRWHLPPATYHLAVTDVTKVPWVRDYAVATVSAYWTLGFEVFLHDG